jgi:hypothetical protein
MHAGPHTLLWEKTVLLRAILPILIVLLPGVAWAITIDTNQARLSINGYADLQYTYMGKMPMDNGIQVVDSDDVSTLNQENMNLIFKVEKDHFEANINLHSSSAFHADTDQNGTVKGHGSFGIEEVFGQWQQDDRLAVRGGSFLAPFGIYNQIRFASALFSPVVLATLYQPPANYTGSGGLPNLMPDRANLMLHGKLNSRDRQVTYAAYIGSGERDASGSDANNNKAIGARLTLAQNEQRFGFSVYNTKDPSTGTRTHLGIDLDVTLHGVNLQSEALKVNTSRRADVLSYYVRLSRTLGNTTPFVSYDVLKDRASSIYSKGMYRWSGGVSHHMMANLLTKAEYHFHRYHNTPSLGASTDQSHMVRLAIIMVF